MKNFVGRDIPDCLLAGGREVYQGKNAKDGVYFTKAGPRVRRCEKPVETKVVPTLKEALLRCGAHDGMTVSFHHHLRDGDYVVNLTEVKAGNWAYVEDEMQQIVDVCRAAGVPSKVIFENCLLTDEEKIALCEVANRVLPTFVKTSTGFSTGGATVKDVRLMRAHVDPRVKVKAAGGIRTADAFLDMVRAGAERIGCSAGVPIMDELRRRFEERGVSSIEL